MAARLAHCGGSNPPGPKEAATPSGVSFDLAQDGNRQGGLAIGNLNRTGRFMTRPIPDKAEIALEYPDKLYIGTFERAARFDAHFDETGISLALHRTGDADTRKSVRIHIHYGLFAEILRDLARTVSALPPSDAAHRDALRDAARELARALDVTAAAPQ